MTPERTATGSCRPCLTNVFIGNVCICVCVNTCVCEQGRLRAGKNAEPLRGRKMGRKKKYGEPYNCTSLKPEEFPGLNMWNRSPSNPAFSSSTGDSLELEQA